MDASPLTRRQLRALLAVARRELCVIAPAVERELAGWRDLADRIPAADLRADAIDALDRKRLAAEGAGLLTCVLPEHDPSLLRTVVALEVILDFLDTVTERPADDPLLNARHMHGALVDALDQDRPVGDYYRYSRWTSDGGYLATLVATCQEGCARLGAYDLAADRLVAHAERLAVQSTNHDADRARREAAMRSWAASLPFDPGLRWFEATAGASSTLAIHVLLVLAADSEVTPSEIHAADAAYAPWVNAASTFLDAFVDQELDASLGHHNYLAYYPDRDQASERMAFIVHEAVRRARALPRGELHALIVSGMVAMYLSHREARSHALRAHARRISRAAGSLQYVQMPIMRWFRAVRGLRTA